MERYEFTIGPTSCCVVGGGLDDAISVAAEALEEVPCDRCPRERMAHIFACEGCRRFVGFVAFDGSFVNDLVAVAA